MTLRPTSYDLGLFGVAVFVWLLYLSPIIAMPAWEFLLSRLAAYGWSLQARKAVLGMALLVISAVSMLAVVTHIVVCVAPQLRPRARIVSHVAFGALLSLGFGTTLIVLSRSFPYLNK